MASEKEERFERAMKSFERLINSNEGLFKVVNAKVNCSPPLLSQNGIQGGLFTVETFNLAKYGTEEQQRFYAFLVEKRPKLAVRYLLKVLNITEQWKRAVEDLLMIEGELRRIESYFKYEKDKLFELLRGKVVDRELLEAFKRQFPVLRDLEKEITDMELLVKKLESEIAHVKQLRKNVHETLHSLHQTAPFLFPSRLKRFMLARHSRIKELARIIAQAK